MPRGKVILKEKENPLTHGETWVWTIVLLRRKSTRNWNMMFVHLFVKDTEGKNVA